MKKKQIKYAHVISTIDPHRFLAQSQQESHYESDVAHVSSTTGCPTIIKYFRTIVLLSYYDKTHTVVLEYVA